MLFSSQLSLHNLIELCRALRHSLGAGLTLTDVFRTQARRGPPSVRPVAERIHRVLNSGDDLETALEAEEAAFPPIFTSLVVVGERTGSLPEVFGELEKFFGLQLQLRRRFLTLIAWPALQLFMAIFVIAGLLWILGFIGSMTNSQPLDPLGLGLTGTSGALIFLFLAFAALATPFVLYQVVSRVFQQKASVDYFLLRLPLVGGCLMALALSRFCLALRLTLDTGMSIGTALKLSLRSTGNAAFVAQTKQVKDSLRAGDDLALALSQTGLFSEEFQSILVVAEESGRLPEVMGQQSERYQEEAARRMTGLTVAASVLVWIGVGALIIWAIFRIFMIAYLGPINQMLDQT